MRRCISISSYHNCERGPCDDVETAHCRMFCHSRHRNSRRSTGCQHRMACHASVADVEPDDPCGRMPCHSFHTDTERSSHHSLELVGALPSDSHHNGQQTTKYNWLYSLQDTHAPNIHLDNDLRTRHTYYWMQMGSHLRSVSIENIQRSIYTYTYSALSAHTSVVHIS